MEAENIVRQFRQILLWPLQLMPLEAGPQIRDLWEVLTQSGQDGAWREIEDEFTSDPNQFGERHYAEFAYFLPFVQRFLYGDAGVSQRASGTAKSPIRAFRRGDVAKARVTHRHGEKPIDFDVAHVDLYFFHDIDIVILAVEIHARDLSMESVTETLEGFRRAYPVSWEKSGRAARCPDRVEWLSPRGEVLAASDYEQRAKYLPYVCVHKAPRFSSHWEYLLRPLVPAHLSDDKRLLRYKQAEDDRIPVMSYLAVEDARRITRGDFARLAFAVKRGRSDTLPYSARFLEDFESKYCYDRFWDPTEDHGWAGARYLCSGSVFSMVGNASDAPYIDPETGLLSKFRHQYFLLGLIAHFHKAALLMLSDRLSMAVGKLDPRDAKSTLEFQREVRQYLEVFLRFTHRYWFHEISNQIQARDLFKMWSKHLGNDELYAEVREEVQDINNYLDSRRAKKLADIGMRLGVVATLGFIGVFVTGFFGMNVYSFGEGSLTARTLVLLIVFGLAIALTLYTISISKALANFLDAVSSDRLTWGQKYDALLDVWRKPRRG